MSSSTELDTQKEREAKREKSRGRIEQEQLPILFKMLLRCLLLVLSRGLKMDKQVKGMETRKRKKDVFPFFKLVE